MARPSTTTARDSPKRTAVVGTVVATLFGSAVFP